MNGDDFEQFWAIYPRRVAKKDAEKMWARLTPDQKWLALQAMPLHVRYWQAANREPDRIPHAATWINGERWNDELAMPEAKAPQVDWWRSTAGIETKARELGMWPPRTGEDWHSLKARILAKAA